MRTAPVATPRFARRARVAAGAAAAVLGAASAPAQTSPVPLAVDFDARGGCTARTATDVAVRGTSGTPFRCDLTGLPPKTAVVLTVSLPACVTPSDVAFPRMAWTRGATGTRSTAVLPAAPAFVRVAVAGTPGASQARWVDALSLAATALAVAWSLVYGRRA